MMRRLTAVLTAGMLTMAMTACGGGDSDGDDIAQQLIDDAEDEGIELDEECVREKAGQLSDADAQAIADAGEGETPELSPEGEALTLELFDCVDDEEFQQSFEDGIIEALPEGYDEDCVREAIAGMDAADLAEGQNSPELTEALTNCLTGG